MEKNMQITANVQCVSLESLFGPAYYQDVAAKSATEVSVSNITKGPTHALACFFVGKTCTHAYLAVWLFVYVRNSNPDSMAVQAGASSEAPGPLVTGNANPVWTATRLRLASLGGRYNLLTKEAAIMATTPSIRLPEIQVINGHAVTSSLTISDYFSRNHKDVLRKIETLECSPEFNERNFALVEYSDLKGEKRPCYQITRDGFTFLAMGFTGKRAAAFKEAYINAFNQMEERLHQQEQVYIALPDQREFRFDARALVLTLNQLHKINLQQLYPMLLAVESPLAARIFNLINDSVFLAKKMKERADK